MSDARTIECQFYFRRQENGRRALAAGAPAPPRSLERLPRVARLLALAHRFESYLQIGVVGDQRQLAELGHVCRSRISQIMNLLNLAPDIQESILFLLARSGRGTVFLRQLQPIASTLDWATQRQMWKSLRGESKIISMSG